FAFTHLSSYSTFTSLIPVTPFYIFFFLNTPAPPSTYTLSLHDALPISSTRFARSIILTRRSRTMRKCCCDAPRACLDGSAAFAQDRKSTRLNSSHVANSDVVVPLEKIKSGGAHFTGSLQKREQRAAALV